MDLTLDELQHIKKRISEIMADVAREQEELNEILAFIDTIEQADLSQMSGSASSARSRRRKAKVKSVEEEKAYYERRRAEKEENIGQMWMKISDLQEQESALEKNLGHAKNP